MNPSAAMRALLSLVLLIAALVVLRLAWLARVIPFPLLEVSHLVASIVGVTLLLLSRALARRSIAAWAFSSIALGAGIVTSHRRRRSRG